MFRGESWLCVLRIGSRQNRAVSVFGLCLDAVLCYLTRALSDFSLVSRVASAEVAGFGRGERARTGLPPPGPAASSAWPALPVPPLPAA